MGRKTIILILLAAMLPYSASAAVVPKPLPDPVMTNQFLAMFTGGGSLGYGNELALLYYKAAHSGYTTFAGSPLTGSAWNRSMNLIELEHQPGMAQAIDSAYVTRELIDGQVGVVGMERVMDASGDYSRLTSELGRMKNLIDKIKPFCGTDGDMDFWQSKYDDYMQAAGSMHGTGFSADKIMPNQMRRMTYTALYKDVMKDCDKLTKSLLYWKYRRDVADTKDVRLDYRLTHARKGAAGTSAFVEWLNVAKGVKIIASSGSHGGGHGQHAQQ